MLGIYTRKFKIDRMAAYAAVFGAGMFAGVLFISALGGIEALIQAITDALS